LAVPPEIAAKAPKDAQPFFQSAQAIAAPVYQGGKWRTFSGAEPIVDGMRLVPCGSYPGHTGYEFSSKGQKILFLGRHHPDSASSCSHPEVTAIYSTSTRLAAAATRHQCCLGSRARCLDAAPHMFIFPALGRLRQEESGYSWAPVVFTDQWPRDSDICGRPMKIQNRGADDYQNVALESADWSVLSRRADITVFQDTWTIQMP